MLSCTIFSRWIIFIFFEGLSLLSFLSVLSSLFLILFLPIFIVVFLLLCLHDFLYLSHFLRSFLFNLSSSFPSSTFSPEVHLFRLPLRLSSPSLVLPLCASIFSTFCSFTLCFVPRRIVSLWRAFTCIIIPGGPRRRGR